MSKEIYISSTPHETRLAIVENDALAEIYYERENEYTLAGSIYNGRVTRVLPGMQSAFVDIGLERDAFLYITDFMEEVPDSAEFETTSGSEPRAPRREGDGSQAREDRGGRGRRGGRDRSGSREAAPEAAGHPEAELSGYEPQPYGEAAAGDRESAGSGEASSSGEGTGEGSRRWRGRRGRRRGGRGGAPVPQTAPAESGYTESREEPEGEVLFEGGTDFDENEGYDLGASAEPTAEVPPPAPSYDRGERERRVGRRDRGRSERGQGREGRSEPRSESSSEQRPERFPRGFAPSRNLHGVDAEHGSGSSGSSAEPIILPGESLSKYRKPGEQPAASAAASAPAPTVTLAPPANVYTVAEGWDGGDVLPGETLSRRSRPAQAASHAEPARSSRFDRGRRRGRPESTAVADAPAETSGNTLLRAEAVESPAVASPAQQPAAVETQTVAEQNAAPATSAEYEPTDAAVSYRVDPAGPAEFRHSAPFAEEAEESGAEAQQDDEPSDPEPHANLAHLVTPAPEQPISTLHAEGTEPRLEEQDAQTEYAGSAEPLAEAASSEMEDHDITSISATGAMESHPESAAAPETAAVAQPLVEQELREAEYEPGSGEITEEVLDDEEPIGGELHASSFEELDELEEETLDGAADLGSMLRDMSIDQITRTSQEPEDEFEEDELDEDLGLESFDEEAQQPAAEEHTPEYASTDESYSADYGGATETEHTDEPDALSGPSPERESERRGRRDGRRDNRRGRGERGRPGADRNGRGRHSVQATNLPAISDLLKPGQEILVQIAKEPIAKKGARITSHIALPGRFLVFMPTVNHTGVSRKIESDTERRRLKDILLSEKGDASGGFIVRTAASGASEEELRSDLRFLLNLWADIKARSDSSKSPALIYHDLNLIERILRDQVTDNFSAIWVDSDTEYERVLRFLQRFQPSLIRRVKLYLKDTPLFEQFGISEEINKALRSKVWLKSGGSIVINQTEALVAIDINTGKYVGKTARLEDTIVKTNLDAIPEIVRQIRLRDLGGIIIIDFIDMDERKNRNRVMAALEEELKNDRAPSKVLQFNDFGLVAITRKRVKQSLERTLSTPCNVCQGTGMVKSPVTVCNDIYIEMRKMQKHLDRGDVMLRVHPDVVKQLKSSGAKWLQEMEETVGKTILVKSDPSLHPEQFDIH